MGGKKVERAQSEEEYNKDFQAWKAGREEQRRLLGVYFLAVCYDQTCRLENDGEPLFIHAIMDGPELHGHGVSNIGSSGKTHKGQFPDHPHDVHYLQVQSTEPIDGSNYLNHLVSAQRIDDLSKKFR